MLTLGINLVLFGTLGILFNWAQDLVWRYQNYFEGWDA